MNNSDIASLSKTIQSALDLETWKLEGEPDQVKRVQSILDKCRENCKCDFHLTIGNGCIAEKE